MTVSTRPARCAHWRRADGVIALLLASTPAGVLAQVAAPTPTPTPTVIPGLDNYRFTLPSATPTPTPTPQTTPTPEPTIAPLPRSTPTATPRPAPAVSPTPRADKPEPRQKPKPTFTPTPPTPAPSASPTPAAVPKQVAPTTPGVAAPAPRSQPSPAAPLAETDRQGDGGWWPWVGGALVLIVVVGAAALIRRNRRGATKEAVVAEAIAAAPAPAPQPSPTKVTVRSPAMLDRVPVPASVVQPAELTLELAPRRAGLNLISATAEAELLIRNAGSVAVQGVRIGAALLEAGNGQEGAVAGFYTEPVPRPAVAPFPLAPGEERRVRIVVARPRDAIRGVPTSGRAMFVPVVAVNVLYQSDGGSGQAARAFAIGIGQADGTKLMPFWLDQPPRMYDGLDARGYGPAIIR